MAVNNSHHMRGNDCPHYEIPESIDARPPQLNMTIARDCQGCACSSSCDGANGNSEGGGVGASDDGGQPTSTEPALSDFNTYATSDADSDADWASVNGQEGVDDKIEVGDLGRISIGKIMEALDKHRYKRCICHFRRLGILPDPEDQHDYRMVISPPSSHNTPMEDSMCVEPDSGEHSMATSNSSLPPTSVHDLASRNASPSSSAFLAFAGYWHNEAPLVAPTPQRPFLRLTPYRGTWLNAGIGMPLYTPYSMDLSITEDANSEDVMSDYRSSDMW